MNKKTVLITGCSSGFGKLAAKTFHKNGWNVVATMRSPEKESELAELDGVLVTRLDVTDVESVKHAVGEGLARFGAIDVLVNNAGYGGNGLFEQFSDEAVRAMYDTNVFGLMNVTREVLPHMRRRKEGCIINVTSVAGMMSGPTISVYSSTKFAVEGLTEGMAHECRPLGIRVVSVAPGAFSATGFNAAVHDRLTEGDEELARYGQASYDHIQQLIPDFQPEGTPEPDAQQVADQIYECATAETPVRNPVGADAILLAQMMDSLSHQEFLEKMAEMVTPAEEVSPKN